jgi:hypothetical protein
MISTCATPGIPRISRVIKGSATRVSSAGDKTDELTAIWTMGKSFGLKRRMIGSSISGGRSFRIALISSRMSCVASFRSFSKRKMVMICA